MWIFLLLVIGFHLIHFPKNVSKCSDRDIFKTFLGHLLLLLGVGNLYLWRHWWSEYSKKFWITIGHAHRRKSCGYHKQSRWVLNNAVINFMSYSKSLAQYDFRFHGKIRVMKNHFKIKNHLINQFICKKLINWFGLFFIIVVFFWITFF